MLMDMVGGIELELRDHLGEMLVGFGIQILKRALAYGPLSRDPEYFNDDENFSYVMSQTLHLQHALVTQMHKLSQVEAGRCTHAWRGHACMHACMHVCIGPAVVGSAR